jgi:membrane-bound lytic murein transglycosylase D
VRSGDSLSKIAAQHKTSIKAIQRANELKSNQLKIGQQLIIPGLAVMEQQPVAKKSSSKPRPSATEQAQIYKVKSGDSLWEISRTLKVSSDQLMKWNKLTKRSQLKPGQQLSYYPSPTKSSNTGKSLTYKVQAGDSLASIAQRFSVKVTDIVKWNKIKADKYLQPGQELTLYLAG